MSYPARAEGLVNMVNYVLTEMKHLIAQGDATNWYKKNTSEIITGWQKVNRN